MRRVLLILAVAFAALAAPAGAHPLGNFSMNHIAEVSVSADRVDVRYVLDQAEIPTFQERGVAQRRAGAAQAGRGAAAPAGRSPTAARSRCAPARPRSRCVPARAGCRRRASSSP